LRLIYGGGGVVTNFPVFFKGWAFFHTFLSRPGGLLEYISAFLSQSFYYSWLGALVLTLQAWLFYACTGHFLKTIKARRLLWLRFVPAVLLLVIYGQYAYHFPSTMALLVSLLFVCLYISLVRGALRRRLDPGGASPTLPVAAVAQGAYDKGLLRVAVFVVLSVLLYTVAAGAYLVFGVLCAMYEILFESRWRAGFVYVLLAAAIPYVEGVLVFGVSILDAYTDLLPFSWKILGWSSREKVVTVVYALYLFVPAITLALGLWRKFGAASLIATKEARGQHRKLRRRITKATTAALSWCGNKPMFKWTAQSLVLFVIAGGVALACHSDKEKNLLTVHYYACRRMWAEVLEAAKRYPYNTSVINAVNRALYHTGRLGYDMFDFPQQPDALLLTGEDRVVAYWHKFDTQIDLGLMNMAQKNLTECMEVFGPQPMILKRLALANMVKGNMDSAGIYLGALSKTLFYADWAGQYLAKLDSDPNLSSDPAISRLRSACLQDDSAGLFYAKEKALLALQEQDSRNRMAFEYLMAWYMLNRQLDKIIQIVKRLNDFDYAEVPRLYEQAVLIYVYGQKQPVYLEGRQADPEVRQQIEHFSRVFNSYGRNKRAAYPALARDYGNSYFFYHIYGFSAAKIE